jgi:cell division protein FtsL
VSLFKSKNKFKLFIYFLIFIAAISFFLFSRYGILKYIDLLNQQEKLKNQIELIETENKNLKSELDSLKSVDAKIEKVAREKYNMKSKNEKVIRVEEK